jgi:hypothetical protein
MISLSDSNANYGFELIEEKPCKLCHLLHGNKETLLPECALPKGEKCEAVMKVYKQVKYKKNDT